MISASAIKLSRLDLKPMLGFAILVHAQKRIGAAGLVLVLLASGFGQTGEGQKQAIAAALQNRQFGQALQLLRAALQQRPADPELWTMQGGTYLGQMKQKEALLSYNKALKISPDYLPALKGAAQIEYDSGSSRAIPLIQHVLRLRPEDRIAHAMLAVLEYRRGDCAAAVAHFERAGSLLDSRLPALHARGICLMRLKQLDSAAAVFQQALALRPDDSEERRLLASVQLMAHQPQEALRTLRPLLDAGDTATLDLAASAYEDAGNTEQAVSTLQKAIVADPNDVNLYLDFAHLCYEHSSFQVGVNALSDGIGLQPNAAPLYLARGVLYVQLGQYDNAEADLDKAHEIDPRESLSSAALAVAAVQENDFGRALTTVNDKLKRNPEDPVLLYLEADLRLQNGASPGSPDFELAIRSARKAVALQPSLSEARGVLAKLYLLSGQYKEAMEQCRKALRDDPKNQAAVYHLIQALRRTGNTSEIPPLLKRLAELREDAGREQAQRNRFKLIEDDSREAASQ